MNLSDLQNKEVIDRKGNISKLILEEKRPSRRLFSNSRDELSILWNQIVKIGDDIMLVDNNKNELS